MITHVHCCHPLEIHNSPLLNNPPRFVVMWNYRWPSLHVQHFGFLPRNQWSIREELPPRVGSLTPRWMVHRELAQSNACVSDRKQLLPRPTQLLLEPPQCICRSCLNMGYDFIADYYRLALEPNCPPHLRHQT